MPKKTGIKNNTKQAAASPAAHTPAPLLAKLDIEKMLERMSDAYLAADASGRVTYANAAAERTFGWRRQDDLLGQEIGNCLAKDFEPPLEQVLTRAMTEGLSVNQEVHYPSRGLWFEVNGSPDAKGYSIFFHDISALKRAQGAQRESEINLRRVQALAKLGTWHLDAQRNELLWSDENYEIFGIPKGTPLKFEAFLATVEPDDRDTVDRSWQAGPHGGFYELERRIVVGDKTKWVRERAELEFDPQGRLVGGVGTTLDITDLKRAEQELFESRARLASVIESAMDAVIAADAQQRIVVFNAAAEAMFHYPASEVIGKPLDMLIPKRFREAHAGHIRNFAATGVTSRAMGRLGTLSALRAGGEEFPIEASISQAVANGRRILTVILRDITGRKQAEEATARLAAIVTSSSDAIIGKTLDGTVTSWNEAAERLFGYNAVEMIGQPIRHLIPFERQNEEDQILASIAASRIIENYETVRLHKSGQLVDVSVTVSPILNAAGKIIGASKIAHDITRRKRAEKALRESEERFRGIFEYAGTGIAITDLQGRIQTCNPAYSSLLDYTGDELRRLAFPDLVHPEDRERNMIEIRRLLAQEIPSFEILNRYVAKDGEPVWVHKHVSLLRDSAQTPTHILALVTDMTERKRHEDRIGLLMHEVDHRSKNMLTLVQAVARQTLAADPEDFMERFGERIQALAASQDLLVKSAWKGVDLDALVRSQLAHFKDLIGTRIDLGGPQLSVSAAVAQALGMAMHELATNAGKYGALSDDSGRVEVGWSLEPVKGGGETFVISWRERDGPAVTAPSRAGFGSTVLCQVAKQSLNAQVELNYASTGLVRRLQCPAGDVMDSSRPA